MHAFIQWRTPTAFSASVSVSLSLFLDKLLWHCCGFSCPAFALCGQLPQHIAQWLCHRVRWKRIHWVRWNKIREEASRMLKSWQKKNYGTRYFIWLREYPPKHCNKILEILTSYLFLVNANECVACCKCSDCCGQKQFICIDQYLDSCSD